VPRRDADASFDASCSSRSLHDRDRCHAQLSHGVHRYFFLVFTIGLTVQGGTPLAPLAIGASLTVMVYMGARCSG
jgi:hypothetical protein